MRKKIVFDIGEVIAKVDNDGFFRDRFLENEVPLDLCQQITSDSMWLQLDQGLVSYDEAISYYKEKFELAIIDELFASWPQAMKVYPKMIKTLEWLVEHDYDVYFLSNINTYCLDYIKEYCSFLNYGNGYVASCEAKLIKPNKEIYDYFLKKFDLKAEDCIYLDDNLVNIEMAKKLGFETIWFRNVEEGLKELGVLLNVEKEG